MKVVITGAAGRMGKMNIKLINEDPMSQLSGAVEFSGSPFIGVDAGENAAVGNLGVNIVDDITKVGDQSDVIIDFTFIDALEKNIKFAVESNTAIVLGTTGLKDEHHSLIKEASKEIPIIWAPNFSVGVNLLSKLTEMAAKVLNEEFDAEIIEAHHRMKKDSPSGTAKLLLNSLNNIYQTNDIIYGREGMVGERPARQIGVHAIRGGDIVGDHTVLFAGIGERIELTHKASTRETFARGALRAAKYILKNGIGLYTMDDVLGL